MYAHIDQKIRKRIAHDSNQKAHDNETKDIDDPDETAIQTEAMRKLNRKQKSESKSYSKENRRVECTDVGEQDQFQEEEKVRV